MITGIDGHPMTKSASKSIFRSLGEFFGHIGQAIRTDPTKREVRRTVEEETREDGVILRRTTIEEIELRGDTKPPEIKP
ncbi:MAG: hypothetical protein SGJ09_06550 [Phycisphaerae bacterium]|nr:hypothetical protein [Phycisphaerae bacterium]